MTEQINKQVTETPRAAANAATLLLFCPNATAETAALADKLALSGVRLVVRAYSLTEPGAPSATDVQQMRTHIREISPTLVLASSPWALALTALTATRQALLPFIYWIQQDLGHGTTELDRHATIAQGADCVLFGSAHQHTSLVEQGVSTHKLHLAADVHAQTSKVLEFLHLG